MNYRTFNHERLFNLGLILLGWTLYGFFFASQNYVRQIYFGRSPDFQNNLSVWLTCGYSWAILTVPILYLARRFPFSRENWHRTLAIHVPAAVVFSFAVLVIFAIFRMMFGESYSSARFESLVAENMHSGVLVYFGIIGVKHVVSYLFGTSSREKELRPRKRPDETPFHSTNGEIGHNVRKGLEPIPDAATADAPQFAERFSIKKGGRIVFINVSDIDLVTSEGNYVKLHTNGRSHLLRETMKGMEQKLDPKEFLRVRRSTIVRIELIKELDPLFNGEFEIVLKNGTRLSSSRRYRKNLNGLLKT